ncbi:MAG: putative Ig domain-containing protein [Hormoscilla sp. GM102CHS1]|nr:putative Ig domain-containing protein [Hormoscilla sp. GM102CHS1]
MQFLGLASSDLSGTLPSELGSLSNLQYLYLDNSSLSGEIPSELGSLSNLRNLWLHGNSLSGTISSELGSLSNLRNLWLHGNSLSGTLPESIKDLSANKRLENRPYVATPILDYEVVPGESFSFDISNHFSDINDNITSYSASGLPNGLTIDSSSGAISGTPTTEGNFIVTVTASDDAGGEVSDEFEIEVSKSGMSKSGNFTVTVTESRNRIDSRDNFKMEVRLTLDAVENIDEDDVLNANNYAALKALYNRTSGENWTTNTGWDVSSETPPKASDVNKWHGVTIAGSRVTKIELGENSLSGMLPSELSSLSNLQVLTLYNNKDLSGTIPSELGSLSKLQILDLSDKYDFFGMNLSGTIPSELGSLSKLQILELDGNYLSGTLPSFLGSSTGVIIAQ